MYDISPKKLTNLTDQFKKALDSGANPIAAFDADGTLWNTDIGENFFRHQIRERLVDLPENAWDYYVEWHERDPIPAYLWLAQINAGQSLAQVRGWAKDALKNYRQVPVFPHMISIIQTLKNLGVKVYIVTASVKWSVEAAADLVGLTQDDVLGIRTVIDRHGIVTDKPEGAVTWREGKVDGLLEATKGLHPFLAAGNSTGDLFLLAAATHFPLANVLASNKESYYQSEQDLLKEAIKRNWYRITGQ